MLAALPAETRATSAFLDEITAAHSVVLGAIDWHSYSQLILRPYGTSAYAARCLQHCRRTATHLTRGAVHIMRSSSSSSSSSSSLYAYTCSLTVLICTRRSLLSAVE
jgi:hypothetical protein|eukprot:COSAG06_NODE_5772_length_3280_cov_6.017919_4_plen_107_part_00